MEGISFRRITTSRLHRFAFTGKIRSGLNIAVDFRHRSILTLHVIKGYGYRAIVIADIWVTPTIVAVDSLRFPRQSLRFAPSQVINQLAVFNYFHLPNHLYAKSFESMLEQKSIIPFH